MLFQGQEFAASAPFAYFADHEAPLADAVREGRHEFLSQFPGVRDPQARPWLRDPADPAIFDRCKLDLAERDRHAEAVALYHDLIALRKTDRAILEAGRGAVDGAVLSSHAFVLRYFGGGDGDRLLVVNLGCDWQPRSVPEPLLAPPAGCSWAVSWSSENPAYGGSGTPQFDPSEGWLVAGQSAVYLTSTAEGAGDD
jgi:maltooligosyltrehalose trehalohydrolase